MLIEFDPLEIKDMITALTCIVEGVQPDYKVVEDLLQKMEESQHELYL